MKIFSGSDKLTKCQSEIDYMITCVENSIDWRNS